MHNPSMEILLVNQRQALKVKVRIKKGSENLGKTSEPDRGDAKALLYHT